MHVTPSHLSRYPTNAVYFIQHGNKHINWSEQVREQLIRFLQEFNHQNDQSKISQLQNLHQELTQTTDELSAGMLGAFSFIPFVSLYVLYRLRKELDSHLNASETFFTRVEELGVASDLQVKYDGWFIKDRRSPFFHILLSFVTGGVWVFCWLILLNRDLSLHLRALRVFAHYGKWSLRAKKEEAKPVEAL